MKNYKNNKKFVQMKDKLVTWKMNIKNVNKLFKNFLKVNLMR